MAIAQVVQFKAASSTINDTIQKVSQALLEASPPQNFVIGTNAQDEGVIQVTSETIDTKNETSFEHTLESNAFIQKVHNILGEPQSIFHVALDRSPLDTSGAATANVVEYVQTYFPSSRVTPDFRKQVEKDFAEFDEIFVKDAKGNKDWIFGWVLEEQEHQDIVGEMAKCFFIARGWEDMNSFEQSLKSDAFKKALPKLLGWKVPSKMWHVERKFIHNPSVN